jgi:PAS domain S-box-containing protein
MTRDPEAELKFLRERVQELESANSMRSDPLLLALLEHSSMFINVVNPEGRFIATGRQPEAFGSVVGRSLFEFLEPASHHAVRDALAKARATRQPVTYECEGYAENGERGHVYQVRAVPIVTDDAVAAIVLVPTDITERVRLERSLRDSNDALHLAASATGIGFWRWDIPKNEIIWDERLLQIFGFERTPPDYQTYLEALDADNRAVVQDAVRQVFERGVYPTVEHRVRRANDGASRWVLAAATVEKDAQGRPAVLRGGVLDITERKELARQMERAERVQAVGQLAAGIAHNFNNLLAVIIPGLSFAVEDTTTNDDHGLQAALTAALQARDLVKSMLSLTAVPAADAHANADPAEVVRRTVEMCRATFPREIAIGCVIHPVSGRVGLVANSLEQIVLNLLTNARDALEGASGRRAEIDVTVEQVPGPAAMLQHVRITVTDNGAGMSDEVRRRLFEPFFTTKPRHRGTGLGLATVTARLREAGGSIECASRSGQGTTFVVELPLRPAAGTERPVSPEQPTIRLSGRVLIVEDEDLVRSMLRRVLENAGMEVVEASSAAEARAELDGQAVDVVVLDHSMHVESGLAALSSLRTRTRAPVLLFTGYAPEIPRGIAAFLRKPARPDELIAVIHELLQRPPEAG